jgi:hypothetical protein
MGIKWWIMPLAALLLGAWPAWAQEEGAEEGDAPQILTSDLARRTTVDQPRLTVDFVILDTDKVTEVTINGEKQKITPADTVTVRKEFVFDKAQTRIEVTATDEKGNTRTLAYLVLLPGAAPPEPEAVARWFVRLGLRYEIDSNPSNDLSLPPGVDVGQDVEGVVPDEEQEDSRTTLKAIVGLTYGGLYGLLGAIQQSYTKSDNDQFNSEVIFLGGGWRSGGPGQSGFVISYLFSDIGLGDFDYSQTHTITPGFEIASKDSQGTSRHLFAVDLISKNFARDDQEDSSQYTAKWDYNSADAQNQDSVRNLLAYGTSTEGFEQSEFTFLSLDEDWVNRWDSGFRFDIGWGIAYRDYPNQEPLSTEFLGDTRVDIPLRFSLGPGWQFSPSWFVLFGYRYVTNLSNKQPYIRSIYGLTVEGAF